MVAIVAAQGGQQIQLHAFKHGPGADSIVAQPKRGVHAAVARLTPQRAIALAGRLIEAALPRL
jgi:hypothetical protein